MGPGLAMAVLNAVSIAEIKARGSIKDADVLKLRRNYYDDGSITAEEADVIFALNEACPVQDPAWADCFVETITDYQVKQAVLSGAGPMRLGEMLEPGTVSESDVNLLRRILYAAASDGCIAITRVEAEVLFEIDESSSGRDNHPAWTDLFVKAIANCVMAASGYAPPPRQAALAGEARLDRRGNFPLDAIARGVEPGLKGFFAGYREQTTEEGAIARLTRQKVEIITHDAVEPANAGWLAQRIGRQGRLTPNECALLMFLKTESPAIDPALRGLVDKAAVSEG